MRSLSQQFINGKNKQKKNNFQEIYRSKLNTDSLLQNSITISFQKSQLIAMVKLCPKLATEASRWPSSIEQGGKNHHNFSIFVSFNLSSPRSGCSTDVAVAETINYANGVGRSHCSANDKSEWSLDVASRFVVSIIYRDRTPSRSGG